VAYLDEKLQRGDRDAFFAAHRARVVNRRRIGNGASFIVERAELHEPHDANETSESSQPPQPTGRTVVVKTVRDNGQHRSQWANILLEIRALLHEPIRYHPNIVRLLGLRWDASIDTGSPFPVILQEYASFGTLDALQKRSKPLPFSIKQKLCYEVGRGLSIIHACGIVHGDLKHENVLIFPNSYSSPPNQPYTAKLADFGGTVMDMGAGGRHRIPMHTFPYEAPEISERLTEEGAKKTDAYSYGMLVWRCMIDSGDVLAAAGLAKGGRGDASDGQFRGRVNMMKLSDGLLEAAIHSVAKYCFTHGIPGASFNLITSALMFTLRGDPKQRALDRAQVRLRGMDSNTAYVYVGFKDDANKKMAERISHRIPGRHGMDMDSVGFALGRLGSDYDAQNNLPGFRPDLPHPEREGFLFEPLRLRHLLDRGQQEAIVRDFERFATSSSGPEASGELKPAPFEAAFFLFQSYLCGFGVPYDAEKACHWLRRAAEPPQEMATTDYLALAWLNRIHAALGVPNPYTVEKQRENLFWSTIRGHRHCIEDAETLIDSAADPTERQDWRRKIGEAVEVFRGMTGATGMPFFAPRKLTRPWDLDDLDALDKQLMEELGNEYQSCLRPSPDSEEASDPAPDDGYRFDKIYVNHKGHGLLHLAAVIGNLSAIRHLYTKYLCDINLKNQSHGDTVLTCACRTGRFDVAMWCLDNGANPNGGDFCEESPLHCLTPFSDSEMETLVARLIAAGADIEKHSEASRKDVRGILADWEDSFSMTLTPLGRAVLKQSLPAVEVLLKHGASTTGKHVDRNRANQSPVELAAVLTLPDILEELLRHTDDEVPVFDECEMLDAARSGNITPYDPLSLQSRLIRRGKAYKEDLQRTLRVLHERRRKRATEKDQEEHPPGKHLCNEILLGNTDIVSALLSVGHSPAGSPEFRPLATAVKVNYAAIFDLLVSHSPGLLTPTEADEPSLLHVLAQRLPHAPRDLTIAKYLLTHGTPVDPSTPDRPSPLVLAILNGFYELADLLVSHGAGASLNTLHTVPLVLPGSQPQAVADDTTSSTLLGALLRSQTSSALRALTYLVHLQKTYPHIKLSPLAYRSIVPTAATTTTAASPDASAADTVPPGITNTAAASAERPEATTTIPFSALHALSTVPSSEWNSHLQISASILQHILTLFPDETSLQNNTNSNNSNDNNIVTGNLAVNPILGTPITAAVVASHTEVLRALLASPGYRALWDRKVRVTNFETGEEAEVEPLVLGMRIALLKCGLLEARQEVKGHEEVDGLRRAVEVVELLRGVGKEYGGGEVGGGELEQQQQQQQQRGREEGDGGAVEVTGAGQNCVEEEKQQLKMVWEVMDWNAKIAALEARVKPDFVEPEIDRTSEGVNLPVDLSVLTDERPSGWKEGVEMTSEMSLRIFLRHFRKDNQAFGDGIVKAMSKMFNTREDDEGGEQGKSQ
jgi:serine/threonine protein kinase/ankyrin repeat protein